jgi:hypothetical protein
MIIPHRPAASNPAGTFPTLPGSQTPVRPYPSRAPLPCPLSPLPSLEPRKGKPRDWDSYPLVNIIHAEIF